MSANLKGSNDGIHGELQVGGVTQITFDNAGNTVQTGTATVGAATSASHAVRFDQWLTSNKLNFRNVANTFISFFTNTNTAARTYTFQDRDGTIADATDIAGRALIGGSIAQGFAASTLSANQVITPISAGVNTLANALNSNFSISINTSTITFFGGGASCQLGGMVAPINDGTRLVCINLTGAAITILGENGSSSASNRIYTAGLASVTWNNLGAREFIYSTSVSGGRWILIGAVAI
jgi:hypothetical protein